MIHRTINKLAERHKHDAIQTMHQVHSLAEPSFGEYQSSKLIASYLQKNGFKIEWSFKKIPTAFRASWGSGPAIGLLGEYDALPHCSKDGSWGHGCGHNLLGMAGALGAVLAKETLQSKKKKGRVVYYGCPAEETLSGKVFMARDGAFRDLDACLAWHPSALNNVVPAGGSALDSVEYEFFGKTAHGAYAENGRSALDAAILFDVSLNYLREHIPENVRIHTVIKDGGVAPNVVPDYAKTWLFVRGKDRSQVDQIRKRVDACAYGAAMATGTRHKIKVLTSIYSRLPNRTLAELLLKQFEVFGSPKVDQTDVQNVKKVGLKPNISTAVPTKFNETQNRASSDEDTVSWLAPLGRFNVVCFNQGTQGHHWETTEQVKLPLAEKGMCHAAKIFAGTALELLSNKQALKKVQSEFREKTKGFKFKPLISKSLEVPMVKRS